MARRKPTIPDKIMAEHIQLPGAPQVIVTRGWAYQWLKKLGYSTDSRDGYRSVDFMVMHKREVEDPLTDLTQPHMVAMLALMESHANG